MAPGEGRRRCPSRNPRPVRVGVPAPPEPGAGSSRAVGGRARVGGGHCAGPAGGGHPMGREGGGLGGRAGGTEDGRQAGRSLQRGHPCLMDQDGGRPVRRLGGERDGGACASSTRGERWASAKWVRCRGGGACASAQWGGRWAPSTAAQRRREGERVRPAPGGRRWPSSRRLGGAKGGACASALGGKGDVLESVDRVVDCAIWVQRRGSSLAVTFW